MWQGEPEATRVTAVLFFVSSLSSHVQKNTSMYGIRNINIFDVCILCVCVKQTENKNIFFMCEQLKQNTHILMLTNVDEWFDAVRRDNEQNCDASVAITEQKRWSKARESERVREKEKER